MSDLKALAEARRITGRALRLGILESVHTIEITDDKVTVLINRVGAKETRYGYEVFRRGLTIRTWVNREGAWTELPSITQWWSTGGELHTSRPAHQRDTTWEDMCHRPGTDSFPLDNLDRRMQGYDY